MIKKILLLVFIVNISFSWDGYSYEKGNYIDVESYDHKGIGEGEVEYYDYQSGEYRTGYLDMYSGGTGTITNDDTGESFEVEMD